MFKQAYSWDEFTKGFRNYSPTSYGVAGAGTGALVAALNEMRKDKEDRNYWNTLTGAAVGGGVGAGGAYLSSGIPNLVTRLTGEETPAGATEDNANPTPPPPGGTSTTPPGETSTTPAPEYDPDQDPSRVGATTPPAPGTPSDDITSDDYVAPTGDGEGESGEDPNTLQETLQAAIDNVDVVLEQGYNPLGITESAAAAAGWDGTLGGHNIIPITGGTAGTGLGIGGVYGWDKLREGHALNADTNAVERVKHKEVIKRRPEAIRHADAEVLQQLRQNVIDIKPAKIPRATANAAGQLPLGAAMAPPNRTPQAPSAPIPQAIAVGKPAATLADIQDWMKKTPIDDVKAFIQSKKPIDINGKVLTQEALADLVRSTNKPFEVDVLGTDNKRVKLDFGDVFTQTAGRNWRLQKQLNTIFTGAKGNQAEFTRRLREAIDTGHIDIEDVRGRYLKKLHDGQGKVLPKNIKRVLRSFPLLAGALMQIMSSGSGED